MATEAGESYLDTAKEALSLVYVMLVGTEEPWASMGCEERCARAANEAQQAFIRLEHEGA